MRLASAGAPRKRLHLLQQPPGALGPQGVCSSLYPDKSASNGSDVEYVPWGLEAVQALDPVVVAASRGMASKVRGGGGDELRCC